MEEQAQVSLEMPSKISEEAQILVQLIKELIKEQEYEGVCLLFTSPSEAPRNLKCIGEVSMLLLDDVCLQHLNAANYVDQPTLYGCAEELLKIIAAHAPADELLLELLEMVEEQKSEHLFNSALRALQVVLLRLGPGKPRALEVSLSSIQTRLSELPLPEYLTEGYDQKQLRLLEQNDQVQQLLMHYITVGLFYEPLLKDFTQETLERTEIFRDCGVNRTNVLCCFLVQLLGKPLALLDLTIDAESKTNTYTVQCAHNLTTSITQCIGDPYYLLALLEQRVRWKCPLDMYEMQNIFLIEDKLPLEAFAIYLYMLLVERVGYDTLPKVYAPLFIFEAGLHMASALLGNDEPPLQYRALLLAKALLEQMQQSPIPSVSLELEVHKNFCYTLCNIVGYSEQTQLRQVGVQLLRQYILQFDAEGKYLVLMNLLRTLTHTGICGYLAILYKDIVAEALLSSQPLPSSFSGKDFRAIFVKNICHLPQAAETDLIEHSDKVISALNALRFFAIKDCDNRTGFWSFIGDVEMEFLNPLRSALDLSKAHYKAELYRVDKGLTDSTEESTRLKLLGVSIANATSEEDSKVDMTLDRQRKMTILNQNLCTFDLIRSLLARVADCVANTTKAFKNIEKQQEVCE